VTLQADKPAPGVANALFRDIATIMTPENIPFVIKDAAHSGAAGPDASSHQ
jgi:hypothetical protein